MTVDVKISDLLAIIESPETVWPEKRSALTALLTMEDADIGPALIEVVKVLPDEILRLEALTALVELADKRSVDLMISLMCSEDRKIKSLAAKGLGLIGDKKAVPALITLMLCRDGFLKGSGVDNTRPLTVSLSGVRAEAARSLGLIGDPRALGPLAYAALADPFVGPRDAAIDALRVTGWPVPADLEGPHVWEKRPPRQLQY